MKYKLFAAVALALFSVNSYAQSKGADTKPAQFDFDRFYSDACYMSNCANPPSSSTATASVERRVVLGTSYQFRTFQPSYVAPATCTSLLGQADNAFLNILDTGVVNPGPNRNLDLTFNGEGRVQRANFGTDNGVGAVGVRMLIDEIPAVGPTVQTELFFRWIIHTVVDSSLVTDVPNPGGVNQPIINSASVRRFVNLAPGSSYRVQVLAKWSDVFTGVVFEPGPVNFVADGGGRGAVVCVPTLTIAENSF